MIERRLIQFASTSLDGLELPCFDVRGRRDGPALALIAGVHGCEYSSIAAVGAFTRGLDPRSLSGRVLAIPVVNVSAFRTRTPFVSPEDGKNLNRCFPGDPDGTYSEALAHHLFCDVIAKCDYLIDLHGGDLVEALDPFVLYDESPVQEAAHRMATAFGFRTIVCSPRAERIEGTTVAAAADAGIPAIVAEAGGRGLLEPEAVGMLVAGVENTLRALGLLAGDPASPPAGLRLARRFTWLYSPTGGWWSPSVEVGDAVGAGALLGTVEDLFGDELASVEAPEDGTVLFMTSVPAVVEGGVLLGLAASPAQLEA